MQWAHRFYWVLTTVPWGDDQDYQMLDMPSDTREYTPMSHEIKDVNYPPKEIGRPIAIALRDRENKRPQAHFRIPPGCEPIYYRLDPMGFDPYGRIHESPIKLHVIGFAATGQTPPVRVMEAIDERSGESYGGLVDNARSVPKIEGG